MRWLPLAVLLLVSCIPPLPQPGPIPPPPATEMVDDFTTFVADCSLQIVVAQSPKAIATVPACVEANHGVDNCLVAMTKYFEKDTIVCVIVDLNMKLQRRVAMGTADQNQLLTATNANTWIRNHRLGVRR
jgi:hypothetical protein